MKILRLRLRNLHSLRTEAVIDFDKAPLADAGLFAITGDTGAGKTTILDAITLALYGKVCRNSHESEVLSHGSDEGYAECVFEAKGEKYMALWSIRRTKSKKDNSLKTERSISKYDADSQGFIILAARKVREVNSIIEEVTGLDFARFTRSVMLAQGDFATFLKAAPADRSDLLERITGTDIYSQISMAALQRFRQEEASLNALMKEKESLEILSKEALSDLKAQKKSLETESQWQKQVLEGAVSQKGQVLKVQQLEAQHAAHSNALAVLEQEKQAAVVDFQRLDLHKKSLPLQPKLSQWDERQAEIATTNEAISKLAGEEAGLQKNWEAAEQDFQQATAAVNDLKKELPAANKLFDEVTELDSQLSKEVAILENRRQEKQNFRAEQTASQTLQKTLSGQSESLAKDISGLENWLKEHANFASLPEQLSGIEALKEELRGIWMSKTQTEKDLETWEEKSKAAQIKAAQLVEKQQLVKEEAERLAVLFRSEAPEPVVLNRQDLLETLRQEIEAMNERQHLLSKFHEKENAYRNLLSSQNGAKEELDNLHRQEHSLDHQFSDLFDEEAALLERLNAEQKLYERELQFASFEEHRARLQEGEECPVCLSTHHPFREQPFEPMPDLLKKRRDEAQHAFDASQRKKKDLVAAYRAVSSKAEQCNALILKLEAQILDEETAMVREFAPAFDGEDFALSHGVWLSQRVAFFEENLSSKKALRDRLAALHRQLEAKEKEAVNVEAQLKEAQAEVRLCEESSKFHQTKMAEFSEKFDASVAVLNGVIGKYGLQFSIGSASKMFQNLEEKARNFTTHRDDLAEKKRQSGLLEQQLKQTGETLSKLEKRLAELQAVLEKEEASLAILKEKRYQLFEEKDPKTEREKLRQQLDNQEETLTVARQKTHDLNLQLAAAKQGAAAQLRQLTKAQNAAETIFSDLTKALEKYEIASLDDLRAALLPADEALRLERLADEFRLREIQTTRLLESVAEALEIERGNIKPIEIEGEILTEIASLLPILERTISETEANLQRIQQSIGGIVRQLADNERRRETAAKLLERIEAQRRDFNRWHALYDLIGSSDGKKFRIFAQGLTLQKLVQLANGHLENLSGRYLIEKRPGEDLELDIMDTYQADNVRSMNTLSGGESFLVSLALALGLSDLAGRDANIRSLFIDEGFGTLDDQTLDLAISTLENLQAKGKTIGIISHVKELKERIATQIKVVKTGGGVSEVLIEN